MGGGGSGSNVLGTKKSLVHLAPPTGGFSPWKYGDVRKGNCLLTQSELNNVEDMSGNIQLCTLKENIFESFKDCRNMITRCHKCPKIEKSQDFPTLKGFQTKNCSTGFQDPFESLLEGGLEFIVEAWRRFFLDTLKSWVTCLVPKVG